MRTTATTSSLVLIVAAFLVGSTPSLVEANPRGQDLPFETKFGEEVPPDGPPPVNDKDLPKLRPPEEWTEELWMQVKWPVKASDVERRPIEDKVENAHTECQFVLETEESCYDWSGPGYIKIKMKNCDPRSTDWIGLFKAKPNNEVDQDNGYNYWGKSYDWEFACGSRSCSYSTVYNFNIFENWWQYVGNGDYKLDDGQYKIYLFSNDGYLVKAETVGFEVRNEYGFCASQVVPTRAPTPFPTNPPTNAGQCKDARHWFVIPNGKRKRCRWARRRSAKKCRRRLLGLTGLSNLRVRDVCPKTCRNCPSTSPDPTGTPTRLPTSNPTENPTRNPTKKPTKLPTPNPTPAPVPPTAPPTQSPTNTFAPSETFAPSTTFRPSSTFRPTFSPTVTFDPTGVPV